MGCSLNFMALASVNGFKPIAPRLKVHLPWMLVTLLDDKMKPVDAF
jgi:hypothetical protein